MSRFKPTSSSSSRLVAPAPEYEPSVALESTAPAPSGDAVRLTGRAVLAEEDGGQFAKLGFILLCAYFLAGLVTEWTLRLIGTSGYIAAMLVAVLPVAWLGAGTRFRGLRHPLGIWWLGYIGWIFIDVPFSVWRGGTVTLLMNYVPRSFMLFFFITALAVTVRNCRILTYVAITCAVFTLFSCVKFGTFEGGRFRVPDSLFYANSNDLALGLLLGITQFTFLFYRRGVFKKIFAVICIAGSVVYMLRTGSRGCMLASVAYVVLIFVLSRKKILVLGLALAAAAIGLVALPSSTMQRLMLLGMDQNLEANAQDIGAVDSRLERTYLIKRSFEETLKHPLFGVGPGQFAVAVAGEAMKKGEYAAWVGTHNSYTQVSSECGLPAFICYCAVIVFCFKLSYRVFRATRDNPELVDINGISFVLLSGIFVYSIATFFFHMAYTGNLPTMSGLTLALYLVSKPLLQGAAPNATSRKMMPAAIPRSSL